MRNAADVSQLIKTLRREKADYIPIAELGIHPKIKEKFLGRKILNLKDEIEFWYKGGYDYIKLQPIFNFEAVSSEQNFTDEKTDAVRKWAPESEGLISSLDDLEKIYFLDSNEIDFSNFEKVKDNLPEGMGVIGYCSDLYIMSSEM